MSPTNRRKFLAVAGALSAGFAGCLGDASTGADDSTPSTRTNDTTDTTDTTNSTTTADEPPQQASFSVSDSAIRAVGGAWVAVVNPTVRKAVEYESIMGSGGVLSPGERQFVVAEVQSQDGETVSAKGKPEYDAFELVVDGEIYPANDVGGIGAGSRRFAERGEVRYDMGYADESDVGWIAFEPPSPLDASEAAIRCRYDGDNAEWSLPDDAVAKLSKPAPKFELQSFDATMEGSNAKLSFAAKNVSKNDGRFLAALYWPTNEMYDDDESTIIERSVEAGGAVEWSKEFGTEYTTGTVSTHIDGAVTGTAKVDVEE